MLEDDARKLGPIRKGSFRVIVIESDARITHRDLPTFEKAKAFANDAASEAESDTPPVAHVFNDRFEMVCEGCPYWLGTWG